MGMRSLLLLIPWQAARDVSIGWASLLWCVYWTDETRSSDETGKYLLSLSLTQTLPLNHSFGLKTRGLCKHIVCFQFEATITSSLLRGCGLFFMLLPDLEPAWCRHGQFLELGLSRTKLKALLGDWCQNPWCCQCLRSCGSHILWVCWFSGQTQSCTPKDAQRHAQEQPLGSHGQGGVQGCGVAPPKQSSVSRLTCENKQKGNAILLLTPRAAGLHHGACVGSPNHKQHSQSIPRQAQMGVVGSDSHPQVGAAVSLGSPPPTATVLWLVRSSTSLAGTVTAPAPSPQSKHRALLYRAATSFPSKFSAFFFQTDPDLPLPQWGAQAPAVCPTTAVSLLFQYLLTDFIQVK